MDYMDMEEDLHQHWLNIFPRSLRLFYPIRLTLRFYATCVLIWDISWLIFFSACSIIRSFYRFVIPPSQKSVHDEIALIVGTGRGVGKEIAKQLATLGTTIICVDINTEANEETAREVQQLTPYRTKRVWTYTCDVTKQKEVLKLILDIKNDCGEVTMLFHCCGIPSPHSLLADTPNDIHKTMDLTITSLYWLFDAFVPVMKRHNHGHIVALTSVAGLSGQMGQMPLSMAQFAVQGLAESLLEELRISKTDNVHVTIVHIYPFVLNADSATDIRLRLPSYFGTIRARDAAKSIVDAVRRNYVEVSIPKHLIFIGHLLRILPREATAMIRDMLDTGVDFG